MKINTKNILSKLPDNIREYISIIKQTAEKINTVVYLIGGPVRDLLLNRKSIDLDIMVKDDALKFATLFASKSGGNLTIYKERLTATVAIPGSNSVDIAAMRTETYDRPGALPGVRSTSDIVKDLSRRDFTINAMALKLDAPDSTELVDPFNGYSDLKASVIRFLHSRSFIDDPTRIYRAIRFEIRFGFTIEEQTLKALKNAVSNNALKTISGQRCIKEINIYLKEKDPFVFINRAYEVGAMSNIISDHKALDDIGNTFKKIKNKKILNEEDKKLLLFASLFIHRTPNEVTNMAGYFGMTRKQRHTIIDTKLLVNILGGNPSKFDSIIKRYGNHARLLAYIITGDKLLLPYIKLQ